MPSILSKLKMQLIKYIQFTLIIIWFLVPIRQFKTRFFGYFLVLALMDPLYILLTQFIVIDSPSYYLFCTIALIFPTLFDLQKKYTIGLIGFFILWSWLAFYKFPAQLIAIQIIIHLIIFIFFLKVLILFFSKHRNLLLFHFILLIYEFSILLKFFVYSTQIGIGPIYYYVTTAIEILIGIFFIFVNEKNSPLIKI